MHTTIRQIILAVAALLLLTATGFAQGQTQPIPTPDPPALGAASYVLMDYHSGRILAEKNAKAKRDPASLTKLMTAYVVFKELQAGNLSMEDKVRVSEHAWRAPGSRMFIEAGDEIAVKNLLKGVIIQSGNDASVALAEQVAGTEETFAQVMNQYADALGMDNTHYTNATGLPHGKHYTTAEDTALLASALIRDFPKYYKLYSQKAFTWNGIRQTNRNKLLWRDKTVDGLKTGYTEAAGYCLTSSAKREGMRLIAVVMGTSSANERINQSQALLNYGFRFYETHRLYEGGKSLTEARVWKGAADTAPLGIMHDLYITIPKRRYDNLDASLSVNNLIVAPIRKGQPYGRVTVKLSEHTVAEMPLVALKDIGAGGVVGNLMDEVLLWFE